MITGPPSITIGDVFPSRRIISPATKTTVVIVDPAYRIKGGTRIFSREEAEAYCSAFHVELENEFEEVDGLDLIKPMQGRMVTE